MPGSTVMTKPGSSCRVMRRNAETELGRPLFTFGIADDVAEILHVVHIEAHHVADAVREEERVGADLDRVVRVALHQSEGGETAGDGSSSEAVHFTVVVPRPGGRDDGHLGGEDDLVDPALPVGESAVDRKGAGDVRGVESGRLGPRVHEQEIAVGKRVVIAVVVEHLAADRDDGGEGLLAAEFERPGLHQTGDLELVTSRARLGHGHPVHLGGDGQGALDLGDLLVGLDGRWVQTARTRSSETPFPTFSGLASRRSASWNARSAR